MMKKVLISIGILLAAFAVVGLFTEDPLALAFFGTIAGLFALMTFWVVKYYVDLRRIGVRPPQGVAISSDDDEDSVAPCVSDRPVWRYDD